MNMSYHGSQGVNLILMQLEIPAIRVLGKYSEGASSLMDEILASATSVRSIS